ncbi:MAG: hypothetical protein IPK88_16960 [Saprospiraceae bacterium]|jgi:hypothetical protein|uniref:Uncharacterized protein n=1 Tax=Candidatus Defluviibacterium haderslevense TaxID=2981993 RepID=A0A9D7XEE0_9BACT|nr:hypothetical protein [Candidatus Defluviibacterium haderslevense]MBK7243898.1 hypothetical protein [Candidatus Defluviibacterium haderslevense]MBK8245119.1 hypothetical protein [Candidatus Defluviibacterium haderslevense]MBK9717670.1 hypothetical protein [Candidatus Defluviibacterium haderslevense]MBL0237413.1 hypothetical protein [Candidatus Defluviibacterium haderslevense]
MKKLFLFLTFGLLFTVAQSNAQSCCKKGSASKQCVKSSDMSEAAIKAADADPSIEKKVCAESGKVCFMKKSADGTSTAVTYDEATAKFVNYVPSENSATAKSCSSKSGKACCSKGAKSCAKGQANAGSSDANSVVAPTK